MDSIPAVLASSVRRNASTPTILLRSVAPSLSESARPRTPHRPPPPPFLAHRRAGHPPWARLPRQRVVLPSVRKVLAVAPLPSLLPLLACPIPVPRLPLARRQQGQGGLAVRQRRGNPPLALCQRRGKRRAVVAQVVGQWVARQVGARQGRGCSTHNSMRLSPVSSSSRCRAMGAMEVLAAPMVAGMVGSLCMPYRRRRRRERRPPPC